MNNTTIEVHPHGRKGQFKVMLTYRERAQLIIAMITDYAGVPVPTVRTELYRLSVDTELRELFGRDGWNLDEVVNFAVALVQDPDLPTDAIYYNPDMIDFEALLEVSAASA